VIQTAVLPTTAPGIIRALLRAGHDDVPVPGPTAGVFGRGLKIELYGVQKPVRYECRAQSGTGPWTLASDIDVIHGRRRGLEVRALYLHPKPTKPVKQHRFHGSRCRDCGDLYVWSSPSCEPPEPTPDSRDALPFDPALFRPLLEAFSRFLATRQIGHTDEHKWLREIAYLLQRLDQYDKETLA